ncbi:MAG: hypothetical protein COB37_11990 [Kordiimonadales bacterium]|nr:MAG: hypothetical protein COB37_11990 [Kordiimonadales bacterium]
MKKEETLAQFVDRFMQRTALAVLVMSLAYASSAVSHFVSEQTAEYLMWAKTAFALGGGAIVLPVVVKFVRLRMKKDKSCSGSPTGYMASMFNKAAERAFATGFIFMIILEPLSQHLVADWPPAFFIQSTLSVMIAALGINFFLLNRDEGDELDDDFESENYGSKEPGA